MGIQDFMTTTFIVRRMVWGEDVEENEYSSEQSVGTVTGHSQQMSMQLAESLKLTFTKSFSIWVPIDADVQEQDVLIADDYAYHVKNVQVFDWGAQRHKELHCERELYESSV
jgi:hypothetical protein